MEEDKGPEKQIFGLPREIRYRPDQAEFMGQVNLRLELPPDKQSVQQHTLKLRPQNSEKGEKREVSGSVTVKYEWTPMSNTLPLSVGPPTSDSADAEFAKANGQAAESSAGNLRGALKVTLVGGDNLVNLSYHSSVKSFSSPYVIVFLYPTSPVYGEPLCPSAWRSPSQPLTIHPRWNASHTWKYLWTAESLESPRSSEGKRMAIQSMKRKETQD